MSDSFPVRVEASLTFKRNIRKPERKYRKIRDDVQAVIEQLQKGLFTGDRIPGTPIQRVINKYSK